MDRIQFRRDSLAQWSKINPVLLEGEVGFVLDDPNKYKVGDGIHAWNDLPLRGFNGNVANNVGDSEDSVISQKFASSLASTFDVSSSLPAREHKYYSSAWRRVSRDASAGEYDAPSTYQIGDKCNMPDDSTYSYEALEVVTGVPPYTKATDNKYNLSEAIAALPAILRRQGIHVGFIDYNNEFQIWESINSSFTSTAGWQQSDGKHFNKKLSELEKRNDNSSWCIDNTVFAKSSLVGYIHDVKVVTYGNIYDIALYNLRTVDGNITLACSYKSQIDNEERSFPITLENSTDLKTKEVNIGKAGIIYITYKINNQPSISQNYTKVLIKDSNIYINFPKFFKRTKSIPLGLDISCIKSILVKDADITNITINRIKNKETPTYYFYMEATVGDTSINVIESDIQSGIYVWDNEYFTLVIDTDILGSDIDVADLGLEVDINALYGNTKLSTSINTLEAEVDNCKNSTWRLDNESFSKSSLIGFIYDVSVDTSIDVYDIRLYNLKKTVDGNITLACSYKSQINNIEYSWSIILPQSDDIITNEFSIINGLKLYITYKTDNIINTKDNYIKVEVAPSRINRITPYFIKRTTILPFNFNVNCIRNILIKDKSVTNITINRIKNKETPTYYFYMEATVGDTSINVIESDIQSGIYVWDNEYFTLVIDTDILGSDIDVADLGLEIDLSVVNFISLSDDNNSLINNNLINNNLISQPFTENVSIIGNDGLDSLENYGKDNVRYVFKGLADKIKDKAKIRFEFRFNEEITLSSNDIFSTLCSTSGNTVRAVTWLRKNYNDEAFLTKNRLIGFYNNRMGSKSKGISSWKCSNYGYGKLAFWLRFKGDAKETSNQDIVMLFTKSDIIFKHSSDGTIINSFNISGTDTIDSIIEKINGTDNFEAGFVETAYHTVNDLLILDTEIPLIYNYTAGYDAPRIYMKYAVDNDWHILELLIDKSNKKTYLAIDGYTVDGTISSNEILQGDITIGGLKYSDNSSIENTPITIRNLIIENSWGNTELVNSVASPYKGVLQMISDDSPRLIIFEGHGVDVCMEKDSPTSDDMAASTDRLNYVFNELEKKGYVPVTWKDIIDWKINGKKLPKRCYNIMMDDFRLSNYIDYNKRKPFIQHNVKAGLAVVTSSHGREDIENINGVDYTVGEEIDIIVRSGWYPTSHLDHRNLEEELPSEQPEKFKNDIINAEKLGIYSDIIVYPFGAIRTHANIDVLADSGFLIGVSIVENQYNCKLCNNFFLSRVEIGIRQPIEDVLKSIV